MTYINTSISDINKSINTILIFGNDFEISLG